MTYVEQAPAPALRDLVRTVWVQRVGSTPYRQRNLPTGGIELQCVIGARPRLIGPLTGPLVEALAPGTTLVGIRFHPGAVAPLLGLPARELVDLAVDLDDVWGRAAATALSDALAAAGSARAALATLQDRLAARRADVDPPDPLVRQTVRHLMPWRSGDVRALGGRLAISPSQLRRRCLTAVGVSPKALQRTLRFQGFLALVQSGQGSDGLAGLAAEVGYTDHAHLSRECLRLTGLPPSALLADTAGRCDCGHDHSASYAPFLAGRAAPVPPARMAV